MHITKIEEFSFSHGEHFNTTTGEYHSLNPHTLGRPLTHTEMDYNLIYQKQTLNGFRICGSNNDLTLALSDLGARLEFKQISSTDADWARFQAAGLFDGQFVWNPVGGALPTTTLPTFDCAEAGVITIPAGTVGDPIVVGNITVGTGTATAVSPATYQLGTTAYNVDITIPAGYSNAGSTITCQENAIGTTTTAAPPATVIYHAHTNTSWVSPSSNFTVTVAPIMTGSPYTIAGPTYTHTEGYVFAGWDNYSGTPMASPQYQPGDQINLTPGSTTNLYARYTIPTYDTLTATPNPVDEGQNIVVNLSGTNIPDGRTVGWTITGVDTNDISGSLTGTFTMNSNQAEYIITVTNDQLTEGAETLTFTCATDDNAGTNCGLTADIVINDTSTTVFHAVSYALQPGSYTYTGQMPNTTSVANGATINLAAPTWTIDGSSYGTGWNLLGYAETNNTSAPVAHQVGDPYTVTGPITFYARYEEVVCSSDGSITLTNVSRASDGTITGTINVNMTTWDTTNSDVPGNVHVDIIGTGNSATDVDASAYGVFPAADVASNPTSTFTIQDNAWADGQGGSVSVQATLYLCSDVQQQITTTVNVSNNPTYSLSVNGPVNEGGNMVFTLTTTDLNDGDVVPFALAGTATIGVDYSDVNPKEFVIANNSATYTVTTFADNTTEGGGNETIKLTLAAFDSQGNGTFSETVTGEIVDTSQTPTTTTTTTTAAPELAYFFHLGNGTYPYAQDLIGGTWYKADNSVAADFAEGFADALANPGSYETINSVSSISSGDQFVFPASQAQNFFWLLIPDSYGIPDLTGVARLADTQNNINDVAAQVLATTVNGQPYKLYRVNLAQALAGVTIQYNE